MLGFSRQASTEVLFASDQIAGVRTNAVVGRYEPAAAKMRLLADTGLAATRIASGKWIIMTGPAAPDAATKKQTPAGSTEARLPPFVNQNPPRRPLP